MKTTRDSLGGQNSNRRISGARSSRALSTIFQKLRKLDSRITKLDQQISGWFIVNSENSLIKKRKELDMKRKQLRLQRKGYDTTQSS